VFLAKERRRFDAEIELARMRLEERSPSARCFGMSGRREKQSRAAHEALASHLGDQWRRSASGGRQLSPWLRRWLVDSGYATLERDGSLRPTPLGAEIGRAVAAAVD
jgi:hypothetical protein